ncbi:hypothetical protein MJH12_17960, partial [bacterium]|nr:hypothetical protein [bacterium]
EQEESRFGILNFVKDDKSIELSNHKNYDLIQAQDLELDNGEKLILLVWRSNGKNSFTLLEGFRFNSEDNKITRISVPKVCQSGLLNGDIKLVKNQNQIEINLKYQIYAYFLDDMAIFHRMQYILKSKDGQAKLKKHKVDPAKSSHDLFNLAGFYLEHNKLKRALKYFNLAFDENESDDKQINQDHLAHLNYEYAKALLKDKQVSKAKPILEEIVKNYGEVHFGKEAATKLKSLEE